VKSFKKQTLTRKKQNPFVMCSRTASDGTTNNVFGFFMDQRFSYSESWNFRRHFFFTDEPWFHLSGYVNSQNMRTGSRKPSHCAWRDLTDDELTTGYYQQDGATCHTSNPSVQGTESFLKKELSQKTLCPPRSPDLTPAYFFGAYWRANCTKIHPQESNNSKTL